MELEVFFLANLDKQLKRPEILIINAIPRNYPLIVNQLLYALFCLNPEFSSNLPAITD